MASSGLLAVGRYRLATTFDLASIKTTLDTYGHLFEGLDEAAADRLEATYAASDVHAMCTREDSGVVALAAE